MERVIRFRRRLRGGRGAVARLEQLEPRTLFSLSIASLSQFVGDKSGIQPIGLVMDPAGNLFGTTARGGAKNYGIIFEIPATSSTVITLASFNATNGISPIGNLVLDSSGVLWGTTAGGGTSNRGTVFSFQTGATGSAITTVVNFDGVNGSLPSAGLYADSAGNLYGTTIGSSHGINAATLFKISGGVFTKLATLKLTDWPTGGLVIDSSGNIFGLTQRGGTKKDGSIFEFPAGSTSSTVITVASFTGGNGVVPSGNLVLDSGGNIIGSTGGGGSHSDGTIFRFNVTASTITTLASFSGSNGSRPIGSLILDGSGNIFGVTSVGGAHSNGTVFEFSSTSSTITALYSFNNKSTGENPTGPLIMDASHNFFGATYLGGTSNRGVIFKLS